VHYSRRLVIACEHSGPDVPACDHDASSIAIRSGSRFSSPVSASKRSTRR
jgi:hypothetical protein